MKKFRTWARPGPRCAHDRTHYWTDAADSGDKRVHCSDCHQCIARLTYMQQLNRSSSIELLNSQIAAAQLAAKTGRNRTRRKVKRMVLA